MDNSNNKLQLSTSSSQLPALDSPEAIAAIRLDERKYPRYRNISAMQRLRFLSETIQGLITITRIRDISGEEVIAQSKALDEMMMKNEAISGLSIPELVDSFKNGVFGLYGEFYGLSAPNLYGFAKSYLASEKKKAATGLVRSKFEERKKAEKEEQQRRLRAEIEEAKRNGAFVPTGKAWFEPKKVDDVMRESAAHREKVRRQAMEILNK